MGHGLIVDETSEPLFSVNVTSWSNRWDDGGDLPSTHERDWVTGSTM